MSIHKPADYLEVYRIKAAAADVHELSGRSGRPDLTQFVGSRIVERLGVDEGECIVDVGCGDGNLLMQFAAQPARASSLVGVLPSDEEVARVRDHLRAGESGRVQIVGGSATAIPLADASADKVVLNGVLLLLGSEAEVLASLREVRRVCKPGALAYFGEIPDRNEFLDRPYGDSIPAWLWYVLRKQGVAAFSARLSQVLRSVAGAEPFVVLPKRLYFEIPERFTALLQQAGFTDVDARRHVELDAQGRIVTSATRWNYLARRS